jgi:hypothetical protein
LPPSKPFYLNHDALDLIEAELVAPAIVELRRARRGMVRHRCRLLEGAAILEIGSNPGQPGSCGLPSLVAISAPAARRRIIE